MANTIQIVITADNRASKAIGDTGKALGGLSGAASKASSGIGGFASALGGVATVAGGIIAANLFGKMASGLGAFVSTGLEAVGNSQQLETSLKALLTANNMYEDSTVDVTEAVVKQLMSQDELIEKQDTLEAKLKLQQATYQEQAQKIIQMADAWGEDGLNVQKAKAQHEKLALAMQKTENDLASLVATETTYSTTTKTVTEQVMNQADAFKLASKQTKELMEFVSQVAVISPFETETVEETTKYAIAAGMGVDATKEFVPAFLDMAAAVGISSTELGFAADQLFQVRKVGKLTQIDLRQLRRLGIDLGKVMAVEMGMSIEEFNAEAAKSPEIFDDLFDAVTRYSQNTFAGTSAEMATSVKGLKSTLSDIFVIGARNFWEPLVDAVTPMTVGILDKLSDFVLGGDVAGLGQQLAETLTNGLANARSLFNIAQVLGFEAAIETLVQMIRNAWPQLAAVLDTDWGARFWEWIANTYPQIPTILSELVTNIGNAISENWPLIHAKLTEWAAKFWEWTNMAMAGAGTALAAIIAALGAWLSGPGQSQINELGVIIGLALFDAMNLFFENQEQVTMVMMKIVAGLGIAAVAVTGLLVAVGAQLLAGIMAGMLEKIGVELQPALLSELVPMLQSIAADMLLAGQVIGLDLLLGFIGGIEQGTEQMMTTLNQMVFIVTSTFMSLLGISSPSTVFMGFGVSIMEGLVEGIRSMIGMLPEVLGEVGGMLAEAGSSLLGGLFGGDEGMSFDPTAMLEGMTAISTFLTTTLPAGIAGLTEQFALFFVTTTEQMTMLTAGPLTLFIFTLSSIYLMHLPMLLNIWIVTTTQIVAQIQLSVAAMNLFIGVIIQAGAEAVKMGDFIVKSMEKVAKSIDKAAKSFKTKLIPAMKQATTVAQALADALQAVSAAAAAGGAASKAATGMGFAHGTGPLGFKVPPGFPNDSFPINVQSGERVLVAPRGQSIESIVGGRGGQTTNNYYFNQTVNTNARASSVIGDFRTMQLLMGA